MKATKEAFLFSAEKLAEGKAELYLWTFTFKEVLDLTDTRRRWNHFLTLIKRRWPDVCGLRVFELHSGGHGLHVHLVTNLFIDVNACRLLALKAGWGRIHVLSVPSEQATYLAKYLDKPRPPCFRRWRLWASFGKTWTPTKTKDVRMESMGTKVYAACAAAMGWNGRKYLHLRRAIVRHLVHLTIEGGWDPGYGPGGIATGNCCHWSSGGRFRWSGRVTWGRARGGASVRWVRMSPPESPSPDTFGRDQGKGEIVPVRESPPTAAFAGVAACDPPSGAPSRQSVPQDRDRRW